MENDYILIKICETHPGGILRVFLRFGLFSPWYSYRSYSYKKSVYSVSSKFFRLCLQSLPIYYSTFPAVKFRYSVITSPLPSEKCCWERNISWPVLSTLRWQHCLGVCAIGFVDYCRYFSWLIFTGSNTFVD